MTVETLKHLPLLQPLLERTQLVEQGGGLAQPVALVLAYELLFGEGFRPTGAAERAVLQRKVQAGGGCVGSGWGGGEVLCWTGPLFCLVTIAAARCSSC